MILLKGAGSNAGLAAYRADIAPIVGKSLPMEQQLQAGMTRGSYIAEIS